MALAMGGVSEQWGVCNFTGRGRQRPYTRSPAAKPHRAQTILPSPACRAAPPANQQHTRLVRHCQASSEDFRKYPGSIFNGKLTQLWFLTMPDELPQSALEILYLQAMGSRNGGKTKQFTPPNCSVSFTTAGTGADAAVVADASADAGVMLLLMTRSPS